jgi:hypothetical protein
MPEQKDKMQPVVEPVSANAEAERRRLDEMNRAAVEAERVTAEHEAVEGGRYKVGDQFVDANGEPIKARKAADKADDEARG